MRPRLILLAMGLAAVIALISIPAIRTFVEQVRLMLPANDDSPFRRAQRVYGRSVAIEPGLQAVRGAIYAARREEANFADFSRADQANGLYAYLQLLPDLPADGRSAEHRESETGGPGADNDLAARVRDLAGAPPVRLYTGRERMLVVDAYRAVGMSAREAAGYAEQGMGYAMVYRPVLRRLAGGLIAQGEAWRDAGRPEDAVAAWTAAIRLMLDVAQESPRPGLALLATEYVPVALRKIAGVAATAHLSPEVVERGVAEAERVEALRAKWHQRSPGDATNLLPRTGDVVMAQAAHDRMLGSMLASAAVIAVWLVLAILCVGMLPFLIPVWRSGLYPRWRWGGHGRWAAAGVVIGPLVVALVVFLAANLPLAWMISFPSLSPTVLVMLLTPVMVGLAGWWATIPPEGYEGGRLSRMAVGLMAAGAVVVLVTMLLLPTNPQPGRPPAGVQVFRRLGMWVGVESLALLLIWNVWSWIRRRRLRLRPGPSAAAVLGVAAWAWLATAVLGLVVLQINARNDRLHEQAFVRASADPMADRLGASWYDDHLGPSREFLALIQPR